jgi:hypothetical protein
MKWHGWITPEMEILDYVYGVGVEGEVKGLVGKWIYRSVPDASQPAGFYYAVEGKLLKR